MRRILKLACMALMAFCLLALFACGQDGDDPSAGSGQAGDDDDDASDDDADADDDDDDNGENDKIVILYDATGVPHIYAPSDEGAFWGSGYQLAMDRLFQIDINRRTAYGTLSEVLGEEGVESDQLTRTLGLGRNAEESIAMIKSERPDDYALIVAFTKGINRYIDQVNSQAAPMPPEFGQDRFDYQPEPFAPADVIAIGFVTLFGLSSTMEFDILYTLLTKLMKDVEDLPTFRPLGENYVMVDNAESGPPRQSPHLKAGSDVDPEEVRQTLRALSRIRRILRIGEGSNNFALHGDHMESGYPVMVNDSHAHYGNPSNMVLQHLNSADAGGRFDVVGFSFAGVPCVQVGTNPQVAWGATTHFADVMDLWDVRVENDRARIGSDWIELSARTEKIRVRQPDGSFKEIDWEIREVPGYGVLLPSEVLPVPRFLMARGELLLNWPGFSPTNEIFLYFDLDRSSDLNDFEDAVDLQRSGMQNWVAASADGIRYKAHGLVPDRGPLPTRPFANRVLDGDDPNSFWTRGYLADEFLPYLDGDRPFIATGNNDPWGHTADNDPTNDPFYYGSWYSPGERAFRLAEKLREMIAAGPLDEGQLESLQMDSYSTVAGRMIPLLTAASSSRDVLPELALWRGREDITDAVDALSDWDRVIVRSSAEAALFRLWFALVEKKTLGDELSLFFSELDDAQPITMCKFVTLIHESNIGSLLDRSSGEILLEALEEALELVNERTDTLGTEAYTWGHLQNTDFDDPVGEIVSSLGKDGDDSSINVTQSHCWRDGRLQEQCTATAGSVYRIIVAFSGSGKPEIRYNMPFGNAGEIEDWVEGIYRPIPFSREDVESQATGKIEIEMDWQ